MSREAFEEVNVARAVFGEAIVEHLPELGKADLRVLIVHLLRFNGAPGSSYPSTPSVAAMTGLADRSVRRARENLVERGLLLVHTEANGRSPGRYSVDACVRFSEAYRARRQDSTEEEVEKEGLAGQGRPSTRTEASASPDASVPLKEQQKEQQNSTPAEPTEPRPGTSEGEGEGSPEGFGGSLARWLCSEAETPPPSERQTAYVVGIVRTYRLRFREQLLDQDWCRARLEEAREFQADAKTEIGLLHAWSVKAAADLEKRQRAAAPTKRKKMTVEEREAGQKRNAEISAIRAREEEIAHCRRELAKAGKDDEVEFWSAEVDRVEAELRELRKENGDPS